MCSHMTCARVLDSRAAGPMCPGIVLSGSELCGFGIRLHLSTQEVYAAFCHSSRSTMYCVRSRPSVSMLIGCPSTLVRHPVRTATETVCPPRFNILEFAKHASIEHSEKLALWPSSNAYDVDATLIDCDSTPKTLGWSWASGGVTCTSGCEPCNVSNIRLDMHAPSGSTRATWGRPQCCIQPCRKSVLQP